MSEGKSFVDDPASGKARCPTAESLTAGTNRLSVVEDQICQDRMSAECVNCRMYRRSISMQRPFNPVYSNFIHKTVVVVTF